MELDKGEKPVKEYTEGVEWLTIEKFEYTFGLAPTSNYQKSNCELKTTCVLEEGDDFLTEVNRIRADVRKLVAKEALDTLDGLILRTKQHA